jgi:hypothetical protein
MGYVVMNGMPITKETDGVEDSSSWQGTYYEGMKQIVTALPNEEHEFDGWYQDGVKVSTEAEYSFVLESDVTLEARFIPR